MSKKLDMLKEQQRKLDVLRQTLVSGENQLDQGQGIDGETVMSSVIENQESPEEIEHIRQALLEGEKSGFSEKDVAQIWEEARAGKR